MEGRVIHVYVTAVPSTKYSDCLVRVTVEMDEGVEVLTTCYEMYDLAADVASMKSLLAILRFLHSFTNRNQRICIHVDSLPLFWLLSNIRNNKHMGEKRARAGLKKQIGFMKDVSKEITIDVSNHKYRGTISPIWKPKKIRKLLKAALPARY